MQAKKTTIERGADVYEIVQLAEDRREGGGDWTVIGNEDQHSFVVWRFTHNRLDDLMRIDEQGREIDYYSNVPGGMVHHAIGGNGDDEFWGCEHANRFLGGGGDDQFLGSRGSDTLLGQAGDDTLFGGSDNDWLDGGTGDDELHGDWGSDLLIGGAGNDELWGGKGFNTDNKQPGGETNTFLWRAWASNNDLGGLDMVGDFGQGDKLVFDGLFAPGTAMEQMLGHLSLTRMSHTIGERYDNARFHNGDYFLLQIEDAAGQQVQAVELHARHLLDSGVSSGDAILRSMIEDGSLSFAYNG